MMVIVWSFYIMLYFALMMINPGYTKRCGIDFLKIPQRTLLKIEGENFRMLKEDKWENIRIHIDYSFIENNIGKIDKKDLIDLKEKIMPKTQEVFQKLLKVKRVQNKLKLNTQYCDNNLIPEKYQTEGVDADLIIFVLVDTTGFFLQNKIEAGAIHCLQHQDTRRPISGYIQFKPQLNVNNSTALDYMAWLAVHEVSHILVINNALYEDYIDPNTLEPIGVNNVIGRKLLDSGMKMNYIKSPKVLEKAKNHFGCNTLDGVPLEYNGGAGTAGAHWAKKYMNTDYMIGDSYGENLISDITLGLFEDSGWYKVDYDMANLFLWGKKRGCGFFDKHKKCIHKKENKENIHQEVDNTINSKNAVVNDDNSNKPSRTFSDLITQNNHSSYTTDFKNEFCTNFNYPVCSTSNIFRGVCKVRKFAFKLNNSERYFNSPYLGGADSLTDKCPIAIEDKGDQAYYGGSCRVGNKDTLVMPNIENICPECACFMSNLNDGSLSQRINIIKNNQMNKMKVSNSTIENKNNSTILKKKYKKSNMRKDNDQVSLSGNKDDDESENTLESDTTDKFSFKQDNDRLEFESSKVRAEENIPENPNFTHSDYMASCFKFTCENNKLFVIIKEEKHRCRSGDIITIKGFTGGVFCPDNENLCDPSFNCKFGCTDKYSNSEAFLEYPNNN